MNLPTRGEVWLADCGLAAKVRPVVVISIPFKETDRALILVVPHTIQATFPLAPPKFIRRLGELDAGQLGLIEAALKHSQGLV